MRLLFFGDSITQGFWDSEGGWVSRLRKFYDAQKLSGKDEDPPTVFNLGISGNSSDDIVERLEGEIKARIIDGGLIIVFAVGVNDSRMKEGVNFSNPSRYAQNLLILLEIAKRYTDKSLFIGLTPCVESRTNPVSWGSTAYQNARIQEFDEVLSDFCKNNSVSYVEVFSRFQSEQKQRELLPDGAHPNDEGHQLLSDIIKPHLESLLK